MLSRTSHSPAAFARIALAALLSLALTFAVAPAASSMELGVSRLAFSRWVETPNPMIHVVEPEGSSPTCVTNDPYGGDGAAISPDGSRIAYENPSLGYAHLYVINVDGSGKRQITTGYGQSATWSSDSRKIVHVGFGSTTSIFNLWVVNASGTSPRQITTTAANDGGPDWSRDGAKIVFHSDRDGRYEIFVMNPDGTGQQRITNSPGHKLSPRWSPDGTRLAYSLHHTFGMHAPSAIHVMNADSTGDVEACGDYVGMHVSAKSWLLRKTMQEMEAGLDPRAFARISRSAIVNLDRVRELIPATRGEHLVRLVDGRELKLTRTYREKLETLLGDRL